MHPVALPMIRYRHIIYTMYIYTYNPQSQPTILTLFLLILSLHVFSYGPSSYGYSNILSIRIKNHHITTLHPFLLLYFLRVQLFFLDFLLKFSTSQLIHIYFGNLYTYVKLHELLKITSKIFKSFKLKQKLNLIESRCVLYHKFILPYKGISLMLHLLKC
jgi:hypothetical protein